MSWIDAVIVVIAIASCLFGIWRGFAKEAVALVTWLAAIWLAWQASWIVEPRLGSWQAAPELRVWAARAIVFVAVLIVGGLLAWLLRAVIRSTGLTSTDRSLGGLFGLFRAVLIIGLMTIGLQYFGLDTESWWQSARLRTFSENVADGIRYYVALGSQYFEEQGLV
jgi:membrane protein required for colicin V production